MRNFCGLRLPELMNPTLSQSGLLVVTTPEGTREARTTTILSLTFFSSVGERCLETVPVQAFTIPLAPD